MEGIDGAARVMVSVTVAHDKVECGHTLVRDWIARIGGTVRGVHEDNNSPSYSVVTAVAWVGDLSADLPGVRP